jgi:hypothetical protein
MRLSVSTYVTVLVFAWFAMPSWAQTTNASTTPVANPARDMTLGRCFQCHSDSIFRDQRLDARGWEATLYRMMARGAVWSGEDIKTMAGFLATDFGPNAPKSKPAARSN